LPVSWISFLLTTRRSPFSWTPPQTISWHGPVKLKTSTNPIGSRVAELVVNGVRAPWLLDTGANQSVVSRTFAERLGVMPLQGVAAVGSGVTGRQSSVRAAVLPTMQVGGAALTNVVLLVIDDESSLAGTDAYQINAILGYPILKALGVVTFTRDEFRPDKRLRNSRGVMACRLTPAIECEVEGRPLSTLDTERRAPACQCRYYELFRARADSEDRPASARHRRVGQQTHTPATRGREGGTDRGHVERRIDPAGPPEYRHDVLFGNLGQDFVDGFEASV
jgi:hypothetical protein